MYHFEINSFLFIICNRYKKLHTNNKCCLYSFYWNSCHHFSISICIKCSKLIMKTLLTLLEYKQFRETKNKKTKYFPIHLILAQAVIYSYLLFDTTCIAKFPGYSTQLYCIHAFRRNTLSYCVDQVCLYSYHVIDNATKFIPIWAYVFFDEQSDETINLIYLLWFKYNILTIK